MHILRDFKFSIPAMIAVLIVVVAVAAPWIAPHGYYEMSLPNKLRPPFWQEGGSLAYPLGTDNLGRDMLSRRGARRHRALRDSARRAPSGNP